ncbi:hypothetical protein ACQKWADRAFT_299027 [Trichoderma austrokoningii]
MCYFEQTRWSCGYWRWGHFRQQCNKEYRMGETCGLKLVYETKAELDVCKLCHDTEKKQRRYDKMYRDVERWKKEGNRTATIERTCGEMSEVVGQIQRMREEHGHRLQSLGQVREKPPSPLSRRNSTRHRRLESWMIIVTKAGSSWLTFSSASVKIAGVVSLQKTRPQSQRLANGY